MSDDLTGKRITFGEDNEPKVDATIGPAPFIDAHMMQDAMMEAGIVLSDLAPPLADRLGQFMDALSDGMEANDDPDAMALANQQTIYATFKCLLILVEALNEAAAATIAAMMKREGRA